MHITNKTQKHGKKILKIEKNTQKKKKEKSGKEAENFGRLGECNKEEAITLFVFRPSCYGPMATNQSSFLSSVSLYS